MLTRLPSPHLLLEETIDDLATIPIGPTHRVGPTYDQKLHNVAAQAPRLELTRVTQMLLTATAQRVLDLDAQLVAFDEAIAAMLDEVLANEVLTSVPGIGAISAAAVMSEVGDVRRFATSKEFIGYCGLYPVVWESGQTALRFRMTWNGNRMLKMTFLVASAAARQYNSGIANFYDRLRQRGKSKRAEGGAIARKLAEIAYTLLVRNKPWSMERATAGIARTAVHSPAD